MLIINDTHIGVHRTGGTTPASQLALRDYAGEQLQRLFDIEDSEITINGDLLDGFSIDTIELLRVHEIIAEWLSGGIRTLSLIQGNHDWNPRGDKVSSFHLLCHFLKSHFGDKVRVFDTGFECVDGYNVFCIPHMPNQSLFDIEIEKAVNFHAKDKYLLLHCNYKNTFAEHADHSLNLSDEQVGNLMKAGWTLVLGHEHQGYELRGGRVIVVGNQFPTSVSDCIGDPVKHALRITDAGHEFEETWQAAGEYVELDWRDLNNGPFVLHHFFRIVGYASAAEAAEVVKAISRFRQECCQDVFVVTNAVKVEGHDMAGEEAVQSIESIRAFDVLGALLSELTPEEADVVKGLLE